MAHAASLPLRVTLIRDRDSAVDGRVLFTSAGQFVVRKPNGCLGPQAHASGAVARKNHLECARTIVCSYNAHRYVNRIALKGYPCSVQQDISEDQRPS
jgi:hypothetical protein